jgi:two-component SAPR family response regulator
MKNVLIVDDEKMITEMFSLICSKYDVNCFCANSWKDGIEIFNNNNIDLVFTDYSMPETNGAEFAKKIKEINKDMKIFLMTGRPIEQNELFEEVLYKPINTEKFIELIKG